MEEEPVHVIRESTRNLLKLNRQHQRDEVSDNNRSITVMGITPEVISGIVQKLKTKSSITATDLHTLKNGLMDDPNSKAVLLNTHGALRGLIRELTGHEAKKQCAAAGCLCNLALADGKTCNTIAKAAGSYLVTALDSLTTDLVVTCAWAVGNLAGSSTRVCDVLHSQGALSRLCALLRAAEEVQDAALYALVHFAHQLGDQLRVEYLQRILEELTNIHLTMSSCQLLFILSCHMEFPRGTPEDLLKIILDALPKSMETHLSTCIKHVENTICCKLTYLIRVLSNMDVSKIYETVLESFTDVNVTGNICRILSLEKNSALCSSLLWLLGNLYNYNSNNTFFCNILNSNLPVV